MHGLSSPSSASNLCVFDSLYEKIGNKRGRDDKQTINDPARKKTMFDHFSPVSPIAFDPGLLLLLDETGGVRSVPLGKSRRTSGAS